MWRVYTGGYGETEELKLLAERSVNVEFGAGGATIAGGPHVGPPQLPRTVEKRKSMVSPGYDPAATPTDAVSVAAVKRHCVQDWRHYQSSM